MPKTSKKSPLFLIPILCAALGLLSCKAGDSGGGTPAGESGSQGTVNSQTSGGGSSTSSGGTVATTNSGSASGSGQSDDEGSFEQGQTSAVISGVNLTDTDFECSTVRNDSVKSSQMDCRLLTTDPAANSGLGLTGLKVPAEKIEAGLNVSWDMKRMFGDAFAGSVNCATESDGLRYQCNWTGDTNIAVRLDVGVVIASATTSHDVSNTIPFKNECDGLPSESRYDAFGDGTPAFPYLWCFSEQLVDFANERCNDTVAEGCSAHIRVGRDLDGSGINKQIGNIAAGHKFVGHFNGNGYKISNIALNGRSSLGIFDTLGDGGKLDHFTVSNTSITNSLAGGTLVNTADTGSLIRFVRIENSVTLSVGGNGTYAGGIVGILYGKMEDCYSEAVFEAKGGYYGSLVGQGVNATIERSAANVDMGGMGLMGGIAGTMAGGSIIDSYVQGSMGVAGGNGYGGGLVGIANSGVLIKNSYAAVSIGLTVKGGLVGNTWFGNYPTVESSYFDSDVAAMTTAIAPGMGPLPPSYDAARTTAQMKTKETYVGWDFVDTWNIDPGQYPNLR